MITQSRKAESIATAEIAAQFEAGDMLISGGRITAGLRKVEFEMLRTFAIVLKRDPRSKVGKLSFWFNQSRPKEDPLRVHDTQKLPRARGRVWYFSNACCGKDTVV